MKINIQRKYDIITHIIGENRVMYTSEIYISIFKRGFVLHGGNLFCRSHLEVAFNKAIIKHETEGLLWGNCQE